MSEAAVETNGYSLFTATTYTNIWDADKLYGCVCDPGFEGGDCSLRSCRKGDDPMTTGQVDEVMAISCLCNGCTGSYVVQYKGATSAPIDNAATSTEVDTILEQMLTVDSVTVTFDGGATACDTDGVSTMITFTQNSGDLPDLTVVSSLTGGTSALSVQTGMYQSVLYMSIYTA